MSTTTTLPIRIARPGSAPSYVCLGCRLNAQRRERQYASLHQGSTVKRAPLPQDLTDGASSASGKLKEHRPVDTQGQTQNDIGKGTSSQATPAVDTAEPPSQTSTETFQKTSGAFTSKEVANADPREDTIRKIISTQHFFRKFVSLDLTPPPFSGPLRDAARTIIQEDRWRKIACSLPPKVRIKYVAKSHIAKHPFDESSIRNRRESSKPWSHCGDVDFETVVGSFNKKKLDRTTSPGRRKRADWEQALDGVLDSTRSQDQGFARDADTLEVQRGHQHASWPLRSTHAASNLPTLPTRHNPPSYSPTQTRQYHNSARNQHQVAAVAEGQFESPPPPSMPEPSEPWRPVFAGLRMRNKPLNPNGIRAQLHRWQEEHGEDNDDPAEFELDVDPDFDGPMNNMTRLPDTIRSARQNVSKAQQAEYEAMASFMRKHDDEPSSNSLSTKFVRAGDLVELPNRSDVPAKIAVYIRRVSNFAQLMTIDGRWVHTAEYLIPYSIPGWVPESMVRPLLPYLPSEEELVENYKDLMETAYLSDLSVPRHVSAPLVTKMLQFDNAAKEIYRKNAATLDSAHALLAHETDLRYGSLVTAAATLLRERPENLSVTAIFAVRQALTRAGFAFNMDSQSHRVTGYLQIRSKEQVRMVSEVCGWLHEWQDDLALTASMSQRELRKHRPKQGASYVYNFLEKARKIVQESRKDRQPTPYGNIGPSQVRIPITPKQQSIRHERENVFTESDADLVRFIEAWCLSELFRGLPRLEALPPLILAATGLYDDYELTAKTGFLFLQELGTLLPYENRVRFDPHLLLPSSQHSKPLLALGKTILDMGGQPKPFTDSMKELRHDWGSMPVYCIDEARAHEIDDGISVERSSEHPETWWVHVHIANPTAFFDRDHPLAKMARHMGETIYMPERAYMMLPRWSTQRHFSLGPGRPCLTFSARLDADGRMVENKVQSGMVRNVFKLTPEEVSQVLEKQKTGFDGRRPELVLTVGGEPPPEAPRKSRVSELGKEHVQQLQTLLRLAEKRQAIRKMAGGLFFDSQQSDVRVWQEWERPGLSWEHPYRWGWRRTQGDPVIQMRTRGLVNWFMPSDGSTDVLVREHMLLACEIAARWCADRHIPAIFRGSVRSPITEQKEAQWNNVIAPTLRDMPNGVIPMAYGMQYLATFGATALATRPFKHRFLGMDAYGKVTSPLRRYGDMIAHWQIEAALRHEARTGRSLITDDQRTDRSFLPFSEPVLKNILVGLQPREAVVTSAKIRSSYHWISQLLFRGFHFGELDLPWKTLHAYVVFSATGIYDTVAVTIVELNFKAIMDIPEASSIPGAPVRSDAKAGDLWEVEVIGMDTYRMRMHVRAKRLLERMALLAE